MIEDALLTEFELCRFLGKSRAWAQRARWSGKGPPFVKVGRTPRYRRSAVEAWLTGRERQNTRELKS